MTKIGRNDSCPCGSGMKYKKCCLSKVSSTSQTPQQQKILVTDEIKKIQESAAKKEATIKVIGVFIFFSTDKGDAWLLEMTEMDAVIAAKSGKVIDVDISESDETIEVNWTHRFTVKNKEFKTTAYSDNAIETYTDYPTSTISASLKKIRKRFSSELLNSIHIDNQ